MDIKKIIKEALEYLGEKLGNVGVEIKGAELVTIKGEQGKAGKAGKDSTVAGPKGKDGIDGKPGVDGKPGLDGKHGVVGKPGVDGKSGVDGKHGVVGKSGKDGSPDTGGQIIEKINSDKGTLIKKGKVEGMDDLESRVKTAEATVQTSRLGVRAGGDTVYLSDLSSQTDGILKTFTVPQWRRAIMVTCSDFPTVLFKDNGFTTTSTTITLTTDNAPSSGSQLGFLYVI